MKESWLSSISSLGRRSFLKIGAAASAGLMLEGWSSGDEISVGASRSVLRQIERDWVSSVCLLCSSACAIRTYFEAGKIAAVGGDPTDPNTGGKMCPLGLSALNLHYNPDRLNGAFRKGANGRMGPAKAADILELIAGKVRQGCALHIYGRITPFASMLSKDLKASCHLDPQLDGMSVYPSFLNTEGRPPIADFENARIALLFDSNLLERGHPFVGYVRRIAEARLRGLQLITLSPFLTNTATAGDWIPIRSRQAASMTALAMARQAMNDKSLLLSPIPSEIAALLRALEETVLEKASGLSHTAIQELSRRFFSEPGPAISDLPEPPVLLLNILKGNLNRRGGLLHPGRRTLSVEADLGDFPRLLRDPRNIVLLHQSNPAFSQSSEIRPILKSSSRAMVVSVDCFMSETAELSDFVLPLASSLETLALAEPLPLGKPFVAAAPPAVKPLSGCRSFDDWLVLLATAIQGFPPALTPESFAIAKAFRNSAKKLAADRAIYPMTPVPLSLKPRMPSLVSSLKTCIDLAMNARNAPLREDQYILSTFEESIQGPWTAPSKWLNEIAHSPKIYISPQRAGRLGIKSGDHVILKNSRGASVEGVALFFQGVHPDSLAIPMHHGHTAYGRIARGEAFSNSADPDMSRIFWGKNRGVNPADILDGETVIVIQKKRG